MTKSALAAALLAAALTACSGESSMQFDAELKHPNGLLIKRPAGFQETATASGYMLVEGGEVRAPKSIAVSLAGLDPLPADARRHRLGAENVRFSLVELGAASGGTEFELLAAKPSGDRFILLTAIEQSEQAEPEFEAAWAVLASARLAAP